MSSVPAVSTASPSTAIADLKAREAALFGSEFDQQSGVGFENVVESRDLLIPRVTILQALSPQLVKSKPEYNPDARPGMICDTGTGELLAAPLQIVLGFFDVSYLEWAPRNSGKGLVGQYKVDQSHRTRPDDRGRQITQEGNLIVESAQFYGVLPEYGNRRVFVPMSSTQRKKAKRWMNLMQAEKRVNPETGEERILPIFNRAWLLNVVSENNAEGAWEGWSIAPGPLTVDLPNARAVAGSILSMRKAFAAGQLKAAVDEAHVEGSF